MVASIEEAVTVLLLVEIIALVTAQVVTRYFFRNPLTWTLELIQVSLIWLVAIGVALASARGSQIVVDILFDRASTSWKMRIDAVSTLFVVGAATCLVVSGWGPIQATFGRLLPSTGLPAAVTYVAMATGLVLSIFHAIDAVVTSRARCRPRELPKDSSW